MAGAACGGSDVSASPGQTFRADGFFSFTYPAEWEQKLEPPAAGEVVGDYQVKVGPRGQTHDLISVTATEVGVRIRGKDIVVTHGNIEDNAGLLSIGPSMIVTNWGGRLGAPVKVSVGALPALRFEASQLDVGGTDRARALVTDVFKGKESYVINCVYTPEGAREVKKACEEVLRTFRVR